MPETLQDRVRSFRNNLQLLAVSPGHVDTGTDTRGLYEKWAELNRECISAGCKGNVADYCSFINDGLRILLANWPEGKTTVGILEVFPPSGGSAFLFGLYIDALDQVVRGG